MNTKAISSTNFNGIKISQPSTRAITNWVKRNVIPHVDKEMVDKFDKMGVDIVVTPLFLPVGKSSKASYLNLGIMNRESSNSYYGLAGFDVTTEKRLAAQIKNFCQTRLANMLKFAD